MASVFSSVVGVVGRLEGENAAAELDPPSSERVAVGNASANVPLSWWT
jgi:hypothetical protein